MKIPQASIIAQLLVDLAQGTDADDDPLGEWPIFVSFLPDAPPAEALCVFDTAGRQDGRLMGTGEVIEYPGFQIMVRGKIYPETKLKADTIAEKLDLQGFKRTVALGSESYYVANVARTGSVIPLGLDANSEKRLYLFTINGQIIAEQV